ncbi:MAG: cyclase family protein [Gammaproteobacteria bacterium]|nr:cyclase family protein [Gammaproteobacteria bacterium]
MDLSVTIAGKRYQVDLARQKSLGIPLQFNGPQPNFFGAPRAEATPLSLSNFVGDTQWGGGCNVSEIRIVPHCNGTHTESAGHILHQRLAAFEVLPQNLMPAVVVSVTPILGSDIQEVYRPVLEAQDRLITRAELSEGLANYAQDELTALVVRTLPNDDAKKQRQYGDGDESPFFTVDAMNHLVEQGVKHLLVDFPSIDKMNDEGMLTNHHIFWNVPEGAHDTTSETRVSTTVTEMVFVSDDIPDGLYLLNLQVPAFHTDAVPSSPVLYPLKGLC